MNRRQLEAPKVSGMMEKPPGEKKRRWITSLEEER